MARQETVPAVQVRFSPGSLRDDRGLVAAALLDYDTAAIHEVNDTEWRVFFRTGEERDRASHLLGAFCEVSPVDVEDEDWARRSQQDLKAVRVGQLVVAPPWDTPEGKGQGPAPTDTGEVRLHSGDDVGGRPSSPDDHLIVIEPSMGFGTGHHATTRLCLRALQATDLLGKRVLDVGTGSGLLAIAAARLGAARVVAVDNDPDAVAAARENVRRNQAAVDLRVVDLERSRLEAADVVVANLTGAVLQRAADTLASLARGGTLIVSGLLEEEEAAVASAFAPYASAIRHERESGWSALTLAIP